MGWSLPVQALRPFKQQHFRFVRVSELQSVTQAEQELERAPSAVSRRLKKLEARLNTQLLTRTTRNVPALEHFRNMTTSQQKCISEISAPDTRV